MSNQPDSEAAETVQTTLRQAVALPRLCSGLWRSELPDRPGKWECRAKDEYMHRECGWPLHFIVTFHVFEKSGRLHAYNGEGIYGLNLYTGDHHREWRYAGSLQNVKEHAAEAIAETRGEG